MVLAKKMQSKSHSKTDKEMLIFCDTDLYGSSEATRVDGEGMAAVLTWDSKVLTVVALLGGVQDLVRDRMKQDGIYDAFVGIAEVLVRFHEARLKLTFLLARILNGV